MTDLRCFLLGHDWRSLKDEPGQWHDDGPYHRTVPRRCQRCGERGLLSYPRKQFFEAPSDD